MCDLKEIRYHVRALKALLRHSAEARKITTKIEAYAANPRAQANNIKRLKGRAATFRMRIGDYRVVFTEDATRIIVTDIGPRGSIYD